MSQDNVIKLARPGEFCDALIGEVLKFGPIAFGDEPGRRAAEIVAAFNGWSAIFET